MPDDLIAEHATRPTTGGPRRAARPWRLLLLGIILGGAATIAIGLVVVAPMLVTHRQNALLERWYGDVVVSIAARLNAGNATNPLAANPRALEAGRSAYTGSCAQCHGARGDGRGVFGQATFPPATDLTSTDARRKTDAELFWITKNGLSFTGMPGFADQYRDEDIWAIVAYLRALQSQRSMAIEIPPPTAAQLALADPTGNAVQRGAAIYFAQGCHTCHGADGNAPGELALHEGGRGASRAIRNGRRGMPAYGPDRITDAELADLIAYLDSLGRRVVS